MNELSLYSGSGGGLLGTKLLGFNHIGYVEVNDYCQRVIAYRIKDRFLDNAPIYGDIRAFIDSGRCELYRGVTDIVTAGFPCQPFSVAGKRKASNDERNMWPATMEVIKRVNPAFCLLENVPGLLSATVDNESDGLVYYIGEVFRDLAEGGYDAKWCVLGADDVGAPHRRKRLWIYAWNTSIEQGNDAGLESFKHKRQSKSKFRNTDQQSETSNANSGRQRNGAVSNEKAERFTRTSTNADLSFSDIANTEHNGFTSKSLIRSNETTGRKRRPEEQEAPWKSTGKNESINAGSIQRSKKGKQSRNTLGKFDNSNPNHTEAERCGLHRGEILCEPKASINSSNACGTWGENLRSIEDIERRPDIPEPLLRRMDDGLAYKLDFTNRTNRLRAVGNGQCPQTVAAAFHLLAGE